MDGRPVLLAFLLLHFLPHAYADEVNAEWYSSGRALGMGNAAIANADDPATAMFYNPAALARNKKFNFEFFNPHFEVGTGNVALNNTTASILGQSALAKADPELTKNPETATYYGFSMYPNLYAQNFALGILVRYEAGAYRRRQTNELLYRSRFLVIPTLGLSFGIFNGLVKFGIAPRLVQITENDKITANYQGENYFTAAGEGAGIGLDSGILLTAPVPWLPTLGFVARNIGDTSFPTGASVGMGDGAVTRHESVKMMYDGGFSVSPKFSKRSSVTLAIDYRDIENQSDTMAGRKINFGTEVDFGRWFFLRGGARAGYWTAGVGFKGSKATLDIGTYAEELDPQRFQEVGDRRLYIRYGGVF